MALGGGDAMRGGKVGFLVGKTCVGDLESRRDRR